MRLKQISYLLLNLILFVSCTEEFDLKIENVKARIMVEGQITDLAGPYYVRLTKSKIGLINTEDVDSLLAVSDATVVISDNVGNIDTLQAAQPQNYYDYLYDSQGIIIDSILIELDSQITIKNGYYQTTHIQGVAGRMYFLQIILPNDEIYTAEAFMPVVPEIDSLSYIIKISEKDGMKQLVPLLYFDEPENQNNYYLFSLNRPTNLPVSEAFNMWEFSIISDEFLPAYVSALNIQAGISPSGYEFYYYPELSSNNYTIVNVTMASLTEEAYNFYKSLIKQYDNDGGAYSPTPATPPGNISGNALGFFRASSISSISKTFKVENMRK